MIKSAVPKISKEKLVAQISEAQHKARSSKKIAKAAKGAFQAAKSKFKEAKRAAKKDKKLVKALKAELAAVSKVPLPKKKIRQRIGTAKTAGPKHARSGSPSPSMAPAKPDSERTPEPAGTAPSR